MGGSSAPLASNANPALNTVQSSNNAGNSSAVQNLLSQYAQGGMSLQDALTAGNSLQGVADPNAAKRSELQSQLTSWQNTMAQPGGYGNAAAQNQIQTLQQQIAALPDLSSSASSVNSAFQNQLATNPITGSLVAADQVRSNPLTSGLFGAGGVQDQAQAQVGGLNTNLDSDRQSLLGNDSSYGLTPEDLAAYGQASGNIARQFGQQGNQLASALSANGLGSSANPTAAAYSGLLGNQNEQLAQSQMQIAQNRIASAMNLAQTRTNADLSRQSQNNSLIQGLGSLGQTALQDQYGRQLSGSENQYNQNAGAAGLQLNNQTEQQNVNNSQFAQQQASTFNPANILLGAGSGLVGGVTGQAGKNIGNSLTGAKGST